MTQRNKYHLSRIFAQLQIELQLTYKGISRSIISTEKLDVCIMGQQMARKIFKVSNGNKMISAVNQFLLQSFPDFIHECPYLVLKQTFNLIIYFLTKYFQGLKLRNLSARNLAITSFFPTGDYRLTFNAFVGNETLAQVVMDVSAITSNENHFGIK